MIPSFEPTPPASDDMEAVISTSFATWQDFKSQLIDRVVKIQKTYDKNAHEPTLLFRGQSCGRWPLWASFDRIMDDYGKKGGEVENFYQHVIRDFVRNGLEMDVVPSNFAISPDDDVGSKLGRDLTKRKELEAFAQHHGLPTRLLDWSESPYVAAFFACCELPSRCSGCLKAGARLCAASEFAIWCLDTKGAEPLFSEHDISIIDNAGKAAKRQVWQRGSFTANWTNEVHLEKVFLRENKKMRVDPKYPVLFRCLLPHSERKVALKDLSLMRINYLSVYPDFVGLSKFVTARLIDRL
jgi:hypothetical protein